MTTAAAPLMGGLSHVNGISYARAEVVALVGLGVTKTLPPESPTSTAPMSEASDGGVSPKTLILGIGAPPLGMEAGAPAAGREGYDYVGSERLLEGASHQVIDCEAAPMRLSRIYGRLPKFSPFVGNFQHAPSAGNRSRSAFFERHLISEEDHARQMRIRTNPYTGTFHFFPGRYSTLHGLQRFRHHPPFHSSFDELDRLADMSRRVTERVRKADNPSLAAVFMNGVFSTSSAVYARVMVFPVRSSVFHQLQPEILQCGQRYRYGGGVDMYRKFGASSLDDNSLTNKSSAAYRDILYRWNGFRLHHMNRHHPHVMERQKRNHFRGRSISLEKGAGLGVMSSFASGLIVRTASTGSFGALSPTGDYSDQPSSSNSNSSFTRRLRGRSPVRKACMTRGATISVCTATASSITADSCGDEGERCGKIRKTNSVSLMRHTSPPSPPGSSSSSIRHTNATGGTSWGAVAMDESSPASSPRSQEDSVSSLGKPLVVQQRKISDTYDVHKDTILGEGSFAAVYVAYHKETGEEFAVKGIKKRYLFTEEEKASVANEIHNMFRVARHRNIIRLYETFETAEHVYLVIEKSTHGNLEQILQLRRKVTELEAMWVVKQLLDAVEYLHSCGVLHCDIKPHNILFSDVEGCFRRGPPGKRLWMYTSPLGMVLKLCDFGLSRKVPDVRYYKHTGDIHKVPFSRITGTTGFIAPELMQKKPYGKPADLWSVGVVLSKMLSGSMPFNPPQRCLESEVSFRGRVWDNISEEAKVFVRSLLETDQCKRLTAKQALGQRWLQTVPEWGPQLLKCGPAVPLPKHPQHGGEGGAQQQQQPQHQRRATGPEIGGGNVLDLSSSISSSSTSSSSRKGSNMGV